MNHYLIKTVFLILLLFATSLAHGSNLTVGFIERPPYIYANADGSIQGKFGRELENIFFNARINARLHKFSALDLKDFFGNEQVDAYIATKSIVDKPDDFFFSSKPLVTLDFYAYSLPTSKPITQIIDLENTSVTIPLPLNRLRGELKERLSDPVYKINVAGHSMNFEDQIEWLEQERVKYVITYIDRNTQALQFSKKIKTDHLQMNRLFSLPLYLVVRKSVAQSNEMMQRINQFIR